MCILRQDNLNQLLPYLLYDRKQATETFQAENLIPNTKVNNEKNTMCRPLWMINDRELLLCQECDVISNIDSPMQSSQCLWKSSASLLIKIVKKRKEIRRHKLQSAA